MRLSDRETDSHRESQRVNVAQKTVKKIVVIVLLCLVIKMIGASLEDFVLVSRRLPREGEIIEATSIPLKQQQQQQQRQTNSKKQVEEGSNLMPAKKNILNVSPL